MLRLVRYVLLATVFASPLFTATPSHPTPPHPDGLLQFPIEGYIDRISQPFDTISPARRYRRHMADDVGAPAGTPVVAAAKGTVRFAARHGTCDSTGWGHVVVIEHRILGRRYTTIYGHLDPESVTKRAGDPVAMGEPIGAVGHWSCWNDHLHFGVHSGPFGAPNGQYPAWLAGYASALFVAHQEDGTLYSLRVVDHDTMNRVFPARYCSPVPFIQTLSCPAGTIYYAGESLRNLAVTPGGGEVYVADAVGGDVVVLDAVAGRISHRLPVGTNPLELAISADGSRAYVTVNGPDVVRQIDTTTKEIGPSIPVAESPAGIAFTPDGQRIYVAAITDGVVQEIFTSDDTLGDSIDVGLGANSIVITPGGVKAYNTRQNAGAVTILNIDDNVVVDEIDVGVFVRGLALDPSARFLYVADEHGDAVAVVRTDTDVVVDTLPVGDGPFEIGIGSAGRLPGRFAFVTNVGSDDVSVISLDSREVVGRFSVGDGPRGIKVSP